MKQVTDFINRPILRQSIYRIELIDNITSFEVFYAAVGERFPRSQLKIRLHQHKIRSKAYIIGSKRCRLYVTNKIKKLCPEWWAESSLNDIIISNW